MEIAEDRRQTPAADDPPARHGRRTRQTAAAAPRPAAVRPGMTGGQYRPLSTSDIERIYGDRAGRAREHRDRRPDPGDPPLRPPARLHARSRWTAAVPARPGRGDARRRRPQLRAIRGGSGQRHRDQRGARLLLHVGRGGHGPRLRDPDLPADPARRPLRRGPPRRSPAEHPLLRAALHRGRVQRGRLRPRHQRRLRGARRPEQAVRVQLRDRRLRGRPGRDVRPRRRWRRRVPEATVLQHRRLPDRLPASFREGQRRSPRPDGGTGTRDGHRDRPAGRCDRAGRARGRARPVLRRDARLPRHRQHDPARQSVRLRDVAVRVGPAHRRLHRAAAARKPC